MGQNMLRVWELANPSTVSLKQGVYCPPEAMGYLILFSTKVPD